jgi:hypothetical protein
MLAVFMLAALLLGGCGSFWEDQGTASRTLAEARLRSAEAARQNAQAAIIDAEARGAMAESQARALEQSVDAVVDLSDDGEYIALFAGLALAVLVFAGFVVWQMNRRPVAAPRYEPQQQPRQIATIKDDWDHPIFQIEQAPHETFEHFMFRVNVQAARATQVLLEAPKR